MYWSLLASEMSLWTIFTDRMVGSIAGPKSSLRWYALYEAIIHGVTACTNQRGEWNGHIDANLDRHFRPQVIQHS